MKPIISEKIISLRKELEICLSSSETNLVNSLIALEVKQVKEKLKKNLIKETKKAEAEALNDCWQYHRFLLKGDNPEFNRKELKGQIYNLDLEGYEDVVFFIGYLRALDNISKSDLIN